MNALVVGFKMIVTIIKFLINVTSVKFKRMHLCGWIENECDKRSWNEWYTLVIYITHRYVHVGMK